MDEHIILKKEIDEEIKNAQKKLKKERLDMSFGELVNLHEDGNLIIDKEFQRYFRWNDSQKSRLIESILVGIPIPSIFVVEDEEGKWELIDGLQRLSTVFSFLGRLNLEDVKLNENQTNGWALESGDILKKIDGITFDELPIRAQNIIKRSICRVEILRNESDDENNKNENNIRYELFERLNKGGSPLSDQEIRNAVYRKYSSNFNNFLNNEGSNQKFIDIINISEKKKQELYAEELVLRFCSLLNAENITKILSEHMDKFMKETVEETREDTEKIVQYKSIFNKTVDILYNSQIDGIFIPKSNRGGFSSSLYDGIMIGLAKNINLYENNPSLLEEKINQLKEDEDFYSNMSSLAHNPKKVKARIEIATKIFKN